MDLNDLLIKYDCFTKEVTKSGGQMVISIPPHKKNIKKGDEALIIMIPKKNAKK